MQLKTNFLSSLQKSKYAEMVPHFKERKTRAFSTIILTLIALILFGLFAINPTLSTIAQLKKQIEDNTELLVKLDGKISNLGALTQKYNSLQNDLVYVNQAIPAKPTVPTLIGQLQAIGKNSGITINRLQALEVELANAKTNPKLDNYSFFAFSLDAKGSYNGIASFFNNLTNFDRIVTIDSISVSNESFTEKTVTITIRGKAYFMDSL